MKDWTRWVPSFSRKGDFKSPWGFAVGVSRRIVLPTDVGRVGVFLEVGD